MNTHVFVVDETTFKIHLEYMFAGTGARDKKAVFLEKPTEWCHHSTEKNLVGMIADISRVRPGDNVIFYLQASSGCPGRFYGVFKAESPGFFDENDDRNYLIDELGKGLSFRIKISAKQVFEEGITEHEYLDSLSGKDKPHQLCWSMIYRKLKANRGCTMITPYEYKDLLEKLIEKNSGNALTGDNFSYDSSKHKIVNSYESNNYVGRMDSIDIIKRLLFKAGKGTSFEAHLQAYILQNFDSAPLSTYLLPINNKCYWIGNEVSCGVGMQRIDILTIEEDGDNVHIRIIELKDEEPYNDILDKQLPWYIEWTSYYMASNFEDIGKQVFIHPCIIARNTDNEEILNRIRNEQVNCRVNASAKICPTEFIGFSIKNNSISFTKNV